MRPGVSWGITPEDKKPWWKDNTCGTVVGGRAITNCPYTCEGKSIIFFSSDLVRNQGLPNPSYLFVQKVMPPSLSIEPPYLPAFMLLFRCKFFKELKFLKILF